ncbi:protein NEGATIVE GRAVITROPIC RESPONSE OF ROOTS-like [Silene latifolia]|uniref:protein NEGATIVE GRAVITROPIC RESPONSE OF ROOTS-like n=1 Tax=Silene latifolia TaxID=37657 RepID=UPI003D7815CD
MKLLSWMQSKISGNQNISKPHIHPSHGNQIIKPVDQKEEFSDWPNGVLSIGTLFNKGLKDDTIKEHNNEVKDTSSKHEQDLTFEEVNQLQKELNTIISSTDLDLFSGFEAEKNNHGPSSNLEEHDHEENDDQHYTIVPSNKAKDVCLDNNTSNAIRKKSLSFLLKKIFICGGGFGPTISLRDPTMLPPKTRINKMLRALLRKKIHPQSNCQTMARNICLERRQTDDDYDYDENNDHNANFYLEGSDNSKWVKTDTEYIVLEI